MKNDNLFIVILLYFGAEPHKNKLFRLQKVSFGMFRLEKSKKNYNFLPKFNCIFVPNQTKTNFSGCKKLVLVCFGLKNL